VRGDLFLITPDGALGEVTDVLLRVVQPGGEESPFDRVVADPDPAVVEVLHCGTHPIRLHCFSAPFRLHLPRADGPDRLYRLCRRYNGSGRRHRLHRRPDGRG